MERQGALAVDIRRIPELETFVCETQSSLNSKNPDIDNLSRNNETAWQMLAENKRETERYQNKGQELEDAEGTLCVNKEVLLGGFEELRMEDTSLEKEAA